ncbi:MAG: peptidoglycan DD-metalloendopeptidase family protein [Ginsengibacter sp.]
MNMLQDELHKILKSHTNKFYPIVEFNPNYEKLVSFDLSESNQDLKRINVEDTQEFSRYIFEYLKIQNAKFGYGGYNERRSLYNKSNLFNNNLTGQQKSLTTEEPRRLHIGIDIWGKAGTGIFSPLDGSVHSFAFNDQYGDYGATIILRHQLEGMDFYTLYGHLSLCDIKDLNTGLKISGGQKLAHFGEPAENGHWPPHLHFQIIKNIASFVGDYPGVCKLSESKQYLENSPDPDLILNMSKLIS